MCDNKKTVYELAIEALEKIFPLPENPSARCARHGDDPDDVIRKAIYAGEKADGYVRDLVEKCRINRERAEDAEREMDMLMDRVRETLTSADSILSLIAHRYSAAPLSDENREEMLKVSYLCRSIYTAFDR